MEIFYSRTFVVILSWKHLCAYKENCVYLFLMASLRKIYPVIHNLACAYCASMRVWRDDCHREEWSFFMSCAALHVHAVSYLRVGSRFFHFCLWMEFCHVMCNFVCACRFLGAHGRIYFLHIFPLCIFIISCSFKRNFIMILSL